MIFAQEGPNPAPDQIHQIDPLPCGASPPRFCATG
jgi:hypothetical protein